MAMSIPTPETRLPRTAVAGLESHLRPRMKQAAATR
jgi:hypothetical protein